MGDPEGEREPQRRDGFHQLRDTPGGVRGICLVGAVRAGECGRIQADGSGRRARATVVSGEPGTAVHRRL